MLCLNELNNKENVKVEQKEGFKVKLRKALLVFPGFLSAVTLAPCFLCSPSNEFR